MLNRPLENSFWTAFPKTSFDAGKLFHSYTFRQIAQLIDAGAIEHGDVEGEQLQWNREHDRRDHVAAG